MAPGRRRHRRPARPAAAGFRHQFPVRAGDAVRRRDRADGLAVAPLEAPMRAAGVQSWRLSAKSCGRQFPTRAHDAGRTRGLAQDSCAPPEPLQVCVCVHSLLEKVFQPAHRQLTWRWRAARLAKRCLMCTNCYSLHKAQDGSSVARFKTLTLNPKACEALPLCRRCALAAALHWLQPDSASVCNPRPSHEAET